MASAQTNVKIPFKDQVSFHSSMKRLYREQLEDAPIKKRVMAEINLKRHGELSPRATRVKQERVEDEACLDGGTEGQEVHVGMVGKALDLSPGLKNTLAQFTLSSQSSLGGPAAFSAKTGQEQSLPSGVAPLPSPSVLGVGPLLVPCDSSTELTHSILEGESISCFVVGGEKRLCLPQVLNSVLRDFSLQQINAVCDELYVYCSRCDANQLHILKVLGILPFNAPSCGLITLTDAQRLCNALLRQGTVLPSKLPTLPLLKDAETGFQVEHQCLGQCQGLFLPHLYMQPDSPCVQCVECQLLFSPQNFVMHSHKSPDKRTCHWGFESAKWPCYLQLSRRHKDTVEEPRFKQLLDDMKKKFHLQLKRSQDKKLLGNDDPVRTSSPELSPTRDKLCDKEKDRKGKDQSSLGFRHLFPDIKEKAGHAAIIHPNYYLYPYDKMIAPNVSLQKDAEIGVEMLDALLKQHYNRKTNSHNSYTSSDHHVTSSSFGEEAKSGNTGELHQRCQPPLAVTLETSSSGKEDDKEHIVMEIMQMYSRQQEKLNATLHRQQQLETELEAVRESETDRLRQLAVEQSELHSELEAVNNEHAQKLGEVQQEQRELEQQLEHLRQQGCTCHPREQEAQYTAQLCELRCRLEQAEAERQHLQDELRREQDAREKLELMISQLQKQILQSASRGGTRLQNLPTTSSLSLEPMTC